MRRHAPILTKIKKPRAVLPSMGLAKEAVMANITRFNPFDELFRDFNKGFWVKPVPFPAETAVEIKLDLKEDDKSYTVRAEIPGVKKEDIAVEIDGDSVSLRAEVKREKDEKKGDKVVYSERFYGAASRSFTLPVEVDDKAVKAEYKDGVLKLVLPKKTNGAARRITVS
jgi:HSP20 family protein